MIRVFFPTDEPVTVSLAEPAGEYDDELRAGRYQTTDGRFFQLPRPAVVALNELDLKPGEPVVITWKRTGRHGRFMFERPKQEPGAGSPVAPIESVEPRPANPPARSARPAKVVPMPGQGRLFEDRGTGTYGPAPRPAGAPIAAQVPYGVVLRDIVRTVQEVCRQESLMLGDGPTQDLITTIYIDAAKRKVIRYEFGKGAR